MGHQVSKLELFKIREALSYVERNLQASHSNSTTGRLTQFSASLKIIGFFFCLCSIRVTQLIIFRNSDLFMTLFYSIGYLMLIHNWFNLNLN